MEGTNRMEVVRFSPTDKNNNIYTCVAASPAETPRKVPQGSQIDNHSTLVHSPPSPKIPLLDTITLSATNATTACQCAASPRVTTTTLLKETSIGQTISDEHPAESVHPNHSGGRRSVDMQLISHQISELANRLDTLETSMKADIRSILEILRYQQQGGLVVGEGQAALHSSQSAVDRLNDKTFQPLSGGNAIQKLTPTSSAQFHKRTGNVQRSISQPECANERNLFG